ncbi:MAG: hypothetical protein JKY37_21760 [Nannocystaceae bacterium]|nr:hypothetical protein [Nannocystaceae bacterium]
MNCDECHPHLIDHAHDELSSAQVGPVSRHLAKCSSCALEFCQLRADLDGVAQVYNDSPGVQTAARLRHRIAAHFAPSRGQRVLRVLRRPIPAYGALAAAAVPIAIWFGLSASEPGLATTTPTELGPVVIEQYDGRGLISLDPHLL